jgi:hypothetical protein
MAKVLNRAFLLLMVNICGLFHRVKDWKQKEKARSNEFEADFFIY